MLIIKVNDRHNSIHSPFAYLFSPITRFGLDEVSSSLGFAGFNIQNSRVNFLGILRLRAIADDELHKGTIFTIEKSCLTLEAVLCGCAAQALGRQVKISSLGRRRYVFVEVSSFTLITMLLEM